MNLKICPAKNGKTVEIFAGSEKVENVQIHRAFNKNGKRTATVLIFDVPEEEKNPSGEGKSEKLQTAGEAKKPGDLKK